MTVIQIIVDQVIDGQVGDLGICSHQHPVEGDGMEQFVKALNFMGILQSVEIIQHHAQFFIAVFRQGRAAFACRRGIILLISQADRLRQIQDLAVEKQVLAAGRRQDKVNHRLQRDQVLSVLQDQVNPVIAAADHQAVSVAVQVSLVNLLQDGRFSIRIEGRDGRRIKHGRYVFLPAEQVMI